MSVQYNVYAANSGISVKKLSEVTIFMKRKAKIALTYFVTIILTIVLLGGTAYFIISNYVFADPKQAPSIDSSALLDENAHESYVPSILDDKTTLLILDAEKRQTASCFLIVRFLPSERKAYVMPIQSDAEVDNGGTPSTIYEVFRTSGTSKAVSCIENVTGIKIDRYMKFDKDSFTNAMDVFGGVNYNVPYKLVYENEAASEVTVIDEGTQFLDATLIRRVLTYPLYKSGETYRSKVLAMLVSDLFNQNLNKGMSDRLDSCFSTIINSGAETNITSYDYNERKKALEYVLDSTDDAVLPVIPFGEYNSDNRYVLKADFVKALPEMLSIHTEEELAAAGSSDSQETDTENE